MFCDYCGKQINDNSMICPYCKMEIEKYVIPPELLHGVSQNKKSNAAWIIGIVSGLAVLLTGLLLIFVLDVFHIRNKDEKKTDNNDKIATADVPDEEDILSDTSSSDTISDETATDETVEEETALVPYGEQAGYTLSDSTTEIKTKGIPMLYDTNGNKLDVNADDYMPDYYYTESIDKIAVTEADPDGNVTYVIKYHTRYEADFSSSPAGEGNDFKWLLGTYTYDFSDYYTGRLLDSTFCSKNADETIESNKANWNNNDYEIKIVETNAYDNGEDMQYDEITGLSHDYLTRYFIVYATVPEDYDGLIMSTLKEYNSEISDSLSDNDNKEDISILDDPGLGYTSNGDNGIFIRVSDYAVPLSDVTMADIMNISTAPGINSFDWCIGDLKAGGVIIKNNFNSTSGIIALPERLVGKWQYIQVYEPTGEGEDYYLKIGIADISIDGSDIVLSMNDYFLSESDGSWVYNENMVGENYTGTLDNDGSVRFNIDEMSFVINCFKSDGLYQYGLGELILPDGSNGRIVLQRP
ncbi:MAG: zinc ribbon domain-containing protein [Eubacterium sp.]|nr:zinc ribbon domain-containing protein [Eubacterium sp.]